MVAAAATLAELVQSHDAASNSCVSATEQQATPPTPGLNQAVGLDLLLAQKKPVPLSSETTNDKLRYFNWAERDTARAAMQTLVAALSEDPINSYFTGSRSRQRKFVKDEVKGYLKALPRAANFIATSDSKAVALWQLLPAETPENELWAGWTRILAVSPRKWAQLVRLELHYEEAHEAIAAAHGPYYYLSFIGTAPEARGRGLGSKLLSEITSRADREGRWCLLEATSEKSEALYARHGFVTYEAFRVSKKAPPVFLMKRAPAAVTNAGTTTSAAAVTAAGGSLSVSVPAAGCDDGKAKMPVGGAAAAAGGGAPLSPVFSITAVSVSRGSSASMLLSPAGGSAINSPSGVGLAAAVAAKQAAAAAAVAAHSKASPPASPLIAVGMVPLPHECVAVDDHLTLPPAATASGSNASGKTAGANTNQPELLPAGHPVDAQVIIRSSSSSSANMLLKEAPVAAPAPAAAVAATATIPCSGSRNGSSIHNGESPVEFGVKQDETGCDSSSSSAGEGGPTNSPAAAGGC